MSEDEDVNEIERRLDKIRSCISSSDNYREFKECVEHKEIWRGGAFKRANETGKQRKK